MPKKHPEHLSYHLKHPSSSIETFQKQFTLATTNILATVQKYKKHSEHLSSFLTTVAATYNTLVATIYKTCQKNIQNNLATT